MPEESAPTTPAQPGPAALAIFLRRLNTADLGRGLSGSTRALIVINGGSTPIESAVVRYHAEFPIRAAVGAQPVVVSEQTGRVVPSRLTESHLMLSPDLPPDRLTWSLTLEFAVSGVPARGWRAYAARFGFEPQSQAAPDLWSQSPRPDLLVVETDCHVGDLSLLGVFDATITCPTA